MPSSVARFLKPASRAGRTGSGAPSRELLGVVGLPLGCAALFTTATMLIDRFGGGFRDLDLAGLGLVVGACLALVTRRRRPVLTLAVVTVCTATYLMAGYIFGPILIALLNAVYGLARRAPLRTAVPVAAVTVLAVVAHVFRDPTAPDWPGLVIGVAWVVVPFTIGVTMRTRQEAAERDRAAQVARHVDAERLRVSRDVHDVVGHGLAAINMQANLALRSISRNPARVPESLNAISSSSAAALAELRVVLARMESHDAAPRHPEPGLEEVPALVDRLAQTGMNIEMSGDTDVDVPTAGGLAAYRVVQEALTNGLRHGTGRDARVVVKALADQLLVTVTNPLPAPGQPAPGEPGSGLGIPGMRERVEAVGGTLSIAGGPDTFEVHATIPREEKTP